MSQALAVDLYEAGMALAYLDEQMTTRQVRRALVAHSNQLAVRPGPR